MINANDVTQAYTIPLGGISQSLSNFEQAAMRNRALQLEMQQQKERHDMNNAKLMGDAFDGLDIGTGTPYDVVGLANVDAGKRKLMEYMKANPNASYADVYMQANDAVRGIRSGIDNAKKLATAIDAASKRGEHEYPYTDANLARQAMLQQAFYNQDGSIRHNPDPTTDFVQDLYTNPDRMLGITNPRALTDALTKHLDHDLAPIPGIAKGTDDYGVPVDYQYKARTYQEFDPKSQQFYTKVAPVEVANTAIEPASPAYRGLFLQDPNNRTVSLSKKENYPGLPADVLNQLSANPVFNLALTAEKRRLKDNYSKELKGVSDDAIASMAGYNLVQNHGSTSGLEFKADGTAFERQNRMRHQANTEAIAQANLRNSNIRTGLAIDAARDRKAKAADKEDDTTPGIFAAAARGDERATAILNNNREVVRIGGVPVPAISLNSMEGVPVFKDPATGRPVRIYLGQDPQMGSGLIKQFMTRKLNSEGKVDPSGGYIPDTTPEGLEIITDRDTAGLPGAFKKGSVSGELTHFFKSLQKRKSDHGDDWKTYEESLDD